MDISNTEQLEFNEADYRKNKKPKKDSDMAHREVLQLKLRRTSKYINACIISVGIALGSYFFMQKILNVNSAKAEVMHSISALEQKIEDISYKAAEKYANPTQSLTKSENTRETMDILFRSYYFPVRCDTLSKVVQQSSETMKHWVHIQKYIDRYSSVQGQ